MRCKKYILKKLSLVVVGVAAGLFIAELVVRVAGLAPDLIRIRAGEEQSAFMLSDNIILGYELRPGAQLDDIKRPVHSRVNQHGQWDIPREIIKPSGTKRVIVLGDSVVVSSDVLDLNNTMTRQLEMMLADQAQPVEVLNFGVTGYCTLAEVELLRVKGLKFKPDLVIVVFVANDYDNFNNDIGQISFVRPYWVEQMFVRTALFRLACLKLNLFGFSTQYELRTASEGLVALGEKPLQKYTTSNPEAAITKHVQSIGDNNVVTGLAQLRQLANTHGFDVLIAAWPGLLKQGVCDIDFQVRPPNTREIFLRARLATEDPSGRAPLKIEQLSKHFGFQCALLSSPFVADYKRRGKEQTAAKTYTNGDSMHPNELGCRVAAQGLFDLIKKQTKLLK